MVDKFALFLVGLLGFVGLCLWALTLWSQS